MEACHKNIFKSSLLFFAPGSAAAASKPPLTNNGWNNSSTDNFGNQVLNSSVTKVSGNNEGQGMVVYFFKPTGDILRFL